jgi:hypothetical protein
MYLAGRRISTRVGIWAAALAVVNPAMCYYSQEARCYGFRLAGLRETESYAVSRFVAPRPTVVEVALLRRIAGTFLAEIIQQT